MPLFEFRCEACSHEFEALVRAAESADCPVCGSVKSEKLFSAPAAHVGSVGALPVTAACPPPDAPPCSPHCCRL